VTARHLYVHVPFCARRCSYCDFAIAVRRDVPVARFIAGIESELAVRDLAARSGVLETLYVGGGTPSRLGPEGMVRLLDVVRARCPLGAGAEVTLEANPEDVDLAAARAWRRAGVTRVSLGVQSFDPAVLQWMHRTHDVAAIHRAVNSLGEAEFDNWSLDLIYALPAFLRRDFRHDLDAVLALSPSPPHVSAYGLTVEPATPLKRWVDREVVREVDESVYERDFLSAHDVLAGAGYQHYEVSNFARPDFQSRHNSAYWLGVPYVGVGPAAHGFDGAVRRWNAREYVDWLVRVGGADPQDPVAGSEVLSVEQARLEAVYLGLRSDRGVPFVPGDEPLVTTWLNVGWAVLRNDQILLRPPGWLRLDALASSLVSHRTRRS
jgi:oxygen-independent coproporphyrinogen-3 oxidase